MNAIVLMAIGEKYEAVCRARYSHYEKYAKRCKADLVVCTKAPDSTCYRSLLAQKLLIPKCYMNYEWIAFMDLDIIISEHAPSLFDFIDENYAFAAVADPRGTEKLIKCALYYWRRPSIVYETHESYFINRGFLPHNNSCRSINGGVFLCNTNKVGDLLAEYYYSAMSEPENMLSHEEALMAYATQKKNMFYELDYRFNTMVLYEIYDQPASRLYQAMHSPNFYMLGSRNEYRNSFMTFYPDYCAIINQLRENAYFLHFAGNMPMLCTHEN